MSFFHLNKYVGGGRCVRRVFWRRLMLLPEREPMACRELLAKYAACTTSQDVVRVQNECIAMCEQEQATRPRDGTLPRGPD